MSSTAPIFPQGKIIVFEGLDGCFKETNYKAYVSALRKFYPSAEIMTESFPRYGQQSAILLEKWLDGSLDRSVLKQHAFAVDSMYSMDRVCYWFESVHGMTPNIDLYNSINDKDIKRCFIFDRYTLSNAVYNPEDGMYTSLSDCEFDYKYFGIPKPDIVICMRCGSVGKFISNLSDKKNKDANELDTEFLRRAHSNFNSIISQHMIEKTGSKMGVVNILYEENGVNHFRTREVLEEKVIECINTLLLTDKTVFYL